MSLADTLRQLLGRDAVADDAETLAAHSGDKWSATETPEVVVFANKQFRASITLYLLRGDAGKNFVAQQLLVCFRVSTLRPSVPNACDHA